MGQQLEDRQRFLQDILSSLEDLSDRDLWAVIDTALKLLGFPSGESSKIDRALEGFFTKKAHLVHTEAGVQIRVPAVREAMNYLHYYYLRRVKAEDREKVVNSYRPLVKRVRNRVRKRFWRAMKKTSFPSS